MKEIHHCMYSVTHLFSGTHVSSSLNFFFLFHHIVCAMAGAKLALGYPRQGRGRLRAWLLGQACPWLHLLGMGPPMLWPGRAHPWWPSLGSTPGLPDVWLGRTRPRLPCWGQGCPHHCYTKLSRGCPHQSRGRPPSLMSMHLWGKRKHANGRE